MPGVWRPVAQEVRLDWRHLQGVWVLSHRLAGGWQGRIVSDGIQWRVGCVQLRRSRVGVWLGWVGWLVWLEWVGWLGERVRFFRRFGGVGGLDLLKFVEFVGLLGLLEFVGLLKFLTSSPSRSAPVAPSPPGALSLGRAARRGIPSVHDR